MRVPKESGPWGYLLPKPGAMAEKKPCAVEIEIINPDALVLANDTSDKLRGGIVSLMIVSIFIGLLMTPGPLIKNFTSNTPNYSIWIIVLIVLALLVVGPATICVITVRTPTPSPTIIDRRHRKIWQATTNVHWVVMDWNENLTPILQARRGAQMGGSYTLYMLMVCELDQNRKVIRSVCPAPPFGRAEFAAEAWEFIRQYMDGDPIDLPPAIQMTPSSKLGYAEAFDEDWNRGALDERKRPKAEAFFTSWVAAPFLYFYSITGYWVARVAPRYPFPAEVQPLTTWTGDNPYRIVGAEVSAKKLSRGDKLYRKIRWLYYQIGALVFWGGLSVLIISVAWR